ncbi:MAG: hypothetical protein EA349_06455 [Halomonadaceae bacterium]|nr:MAG: hypothetical protein EA349_06455 [Halomonadaceae bacterium]
MNIRGALCCASLLIISASQPLQAEQDRSTMDLYGTHRAGGKAIPPDQQKEFTDQLSPGNLPLEFFLWQEGEPRYMPSSERIWHEAGHWAIRQQEIHSERVAAMSRGIDRTLSGETYTVRDNDSYLRLGLSNRYGKSGEMGLEPEVRFRLELPTLEEKFKLVIESDPDDLSSLSEQQREESLREDERASSFTTGALRYLYPVTDRWELSSDVGARLRFPPELFWRSRARSDWTISPQWNMRLDQRFFYFNTTGWGSRSWVGFGRRIQGWNFLSSSEARWVHEDRTFEVAQVLALDRTLRNRHYWRYRLGVLGESEPNWQTSDYFADVLYRNRLYDDWLFAEVIPSVNFPRENSFKANPTITLRIEMFFSGKGDL